MSHRKLLPGKSYDENRLEDLQVFERIRCGGKYRYWYAAWRTAHKPYPKEVCLGSCLKVTREVAMASARRLKAKDLGLVISREKVARPKRLLSFAARVQEALKEFPGKELVVAYAVKKQVPKCSSGACSTLLDITEYVHFLPGDPPRRRADKWLPHGIIVDKNASVEEIKTAIREERYWFTL
jgi:phenylalanyl-tRNA synthetase beta subunit